MIDSLYEPFKKWSEKGSVYIISDPHLEDEDCKLMDSQWPEPQEYIDNIKKVVHKNDTLICLGDVGNPSWFSQINAYKVLIMGNHDKGKSNYKRLLSVYPYMFPTEEDAIKAKEESLIIRYYTDSSNEFYGITDNYLFDEVYEGCLMISPNIMLSHEPCSSDFWCNIHGHLHDSECMIEKNGINITSNVVGYKPISLNDLIKDGTIKNCVIENIHRHTIMWSKNKHIYDTTYQSSKMISNSYNFDMQKSYSKGYLKGRETALNDFLGALPDCDYVNIDILVTISEQLKKLTNE